MKLVSRKRTLNAGTESSSASASNIVNSSAPSTPPPASSQANLLQLDESGGGGGASTTASPAKRELDQGTLVLFARTDREKEEWFKLFKKAAARKLHDSAHYLKQQSQRS